MAVRWPDGSVTGSVRVPDVEPAPAAVEPSEETKAEAVEAPPVKKEVRDGDR